MPCADREKRNAYMREYKRKKRIERGALPKGKHPRPKRTEEQIEESKQKRREWEREWRSNYSFFKVEKKLLWAAKRRAKKRGIEFNITEEDIVVPEYCPYLGIKLINGQPRGSKRDQTATLDRIDNTKGYVKGNVEVISWKANTMKSDATPADLISFARQIMKRYSNESVDVRLRNYCEKSGESI